MVESVYLLVCVSVRLDLRVIYVKVVSIFLLAHVIFMFSTLIIKQTSDFDMRML